MVSDSDPPVEGGSRSRRAPQGAGHREQARTDAPLTRSELIACRVDAVDHRGEPPASAGIEGDVVEARERSGEQGDQGWREAVLGSDTPERGLQTGRRSFCRLQPLSRGRRAHDAATAWRDSPTATYARCHACCRGWTSARHSATMAASFFTLATTRREYKKW